MRGLGRFAAGIKPKVKHDYKYLAIKYGFYTTCVTTIGSVLERMLSLFAQKTVQKSMITDGVMLSVVQDKRLSTGNIILIVSVTLLVILFMFKHWLDNRGKQ